tara:strand:+ start:729 stop:938 length:210 start_codon:yes stop_codon:yes gene_type:complete
MAANKKGLKDGPDNLKETAGSFASSAARSLEERQKELGPGIEGIPSLRHGGLVTRGSDRSRLTGKFKIV